MPRLIVLFVLLQLFLYRRARGMILVVVRVCVRFDVVGAFLLMSDCVSLTHVELCSDGVTVSPAHTRGHTHTVI